MQADAVDQSSLVETLAALRREVAVLAERIAAIERRAPAAPTATVMGTGAPRSADVPTPEIVAIISAAIAAYLGVKPHIRQISILGGGSWAQQGRVKIQASHALTVQRD